MQQEVQGQAAEDIDEMPRVDRDLFPAVVATPDLKVVRPQPQVDLREVLLSLADVIKRAEMFASHHVQLEPLSIRERMSSVLSTLEPDHFTEFTTLFTLEEGRRGVVVTLMAILELLKQTMIELIQTEPYGAIHVKLIGAER